MVLRFTDRVGLSRVGDKALWCGNSRAQVFRSRGRLPSAGNKACLLVLKFLKAIPPAKLETVKDFDMSLALSIQALSRHPQAVSHYLTKYFNKGFL